MKEGECKKEDKSPGCGVRIVWNTQGHAVGNGEPSAKHMSDGTRGKSDMERCAVINISCILYGLNLVCGV